MMRKIAILGLVLGLAACGATNPTDPVQHPSDIRNDPSKSEPGVHISGQAEFGVVKRF